MMKKIDLNNMDVYKFLVFVFLFIIIFMLIFTAQMKSVVSFQNKILVEFLEGVKPKVTTSTTYTSPTTNKYQGY